MNQLKILSIAICCLVSALCSEIQCAQDYIVDNGYIKCFDKKGLEETKTTRIIELDFLNPPKDYQEENPGEEFLFYKTLDINWNKNPEALAELALIANGGKEVSSLCIGNVNSISALNYSIRFYGKIFDSNHEISPLFFAGQNTKKSWQNYVEQTRNKIDSQRVKAIDNWLDHMAQQEEYHSDGD